MTSVFSMCCHGCLWYVLCKLRVHLIRGFEGGSLACAASISTCWIMILFRTLKLGAIDPKSVQEDFCNRAHVLSLIHVCSESSRCLSVVPLHLLVQVGLECAGACAGLLAASVQQLLVVVCVFLLASVSLRCFIVAHASSLVCFALLLYVFLMVLLSSGCVGVLSCYLSAMLSCFLFSALCCLPVFLPPLLPIAGTWMVIARCI